jgi:AcrR family transcriptional regulator
MTILDRVSATQGRARQRGTLRDEQKLATRARLLAAGRAVFEEFGYAGATVDQITDRIGASRGTFYFHFAGKGEVMKEIAKDLVLQTGPMCASLDKALSTGSYDALRAWLRNTIDVQLKYRLFNIAYEEACAIDPEIRQIAIDSLVIAADAMPEYQARWPAESRERRRLRLELLVLLLERFFYRWSVQETFPVADFDVALDELAEIFAASLMH